MAKTLLESVTAIILNESGEGNRVNETIVAEKLGLSRTPVREVLHHLEEEGLIKRRQRSGINIPQFSHQDISEIYDIRAVMEGLACSLLAPRINKIILQKLQKTEREKIRLIDSNRLEAMTDKEFQFHQIIIQNCGNKRLGKSINSSNLILASFLLPQRILGKKLALELRREQKSRKHSHSRVIEALKSGNPAKAERAMRLHILEGKEVILYYLRFRHQGDTGKTSSRKEAKKDVAAHLPVK